MKGEFTKLVGQSRTVCKARIREKWSTTVLLFTYLFLAVLECSLLHGLSAVVVSRGLALDAMCRVLITVVSVAAAPGLRACDSRL